MRVSHAVTIVVAVVAVVVAIGVGAGCPRGVGPGGDADAFCGDGKKNGDDECDGDDFGGASCASLGLDVGALSCRRLCTIDTSACVPVECGNHVLEGGESCDDGNLVDGDGCDSNCQTTSCGNGVVTAGEDCDDGDNDSGDGCSAACTIEVGEGEGAVVGEGEGEGAVGEGEGAVGEGEGEGVVEGAVRVVTTPLGRVHRGATLAAFTFEVVDDAGVRVGAGDERVVTLVARDALGAPFGAPAVLGALAGTLSTTTIDGVATFDAVVAGNEGPVFFDATSPGTAPAQDVVVVVAPADVVGGGGGGGGVTWMPSFASAVAVCDLNHDAFPDLLLGCSGAPVTAFGDGTGFSPVQELEARQSTADGCACADVDGDGDDDAFVLDTGELLVHLNTGNGVLAPAIRSAMPANDFAVVGAADFDGDGDADVVALGVSVIRVLHMNGAATFAAGTFVAGPEVASVSDWRGGAAIADVDSDGNFDVVLSADDTGAIGIHYGNATGDLTAVQLVDAAAAAENARVLDVGVVDLTGDGLREIVVGVGDTVRTAVQTSQRAFDPFADAVTVAGIGLGQRDAIFDIGLVDADAFPDIVVQGELVVGDGSGGFNVGSIIPPLHQAARDVKLVDVDDDGLLDVLAPSAPSSPDGGTLQLERGVPGGLTEWLAAWPPLERNATAIDVGFLDTVVDVIARDVDGDGNTDVLFTTFSTPEIHVFVGAADGSLSEAPSITADVHPPTIGVVHRVSVVTDPAAAPDTSAIFVLQQPAAGQAAVSRFAANGDLVTTTALQVAGVGVDAVDFDVGDFDSDDALDVLFVVNTSGAVKLARGDGAGGFLAAFSTTLPPSDNVVVADVDKDGDLDVVAGGSRVVAYGDGTGAFPRVVTRDNAADGRAVVLDIDGDGNNDVAEPGFNVLVIHRGRANRLFDIGALYPLLGNRLAAGDIDGDGDDDLFDGGAGVGVVFGDPLRGVANLATVVYPGCFSNPAFNDGRLFTAESGCRDSFLTSTP